MTSSTTWWGAAALVLATLAGCGSDSGGDATPPPSSGLAGQIASAAANPANDTSTNPSAPFTVLQGAGVPAATIGSPLKINFTVFSDGAVKTGLTLADMSFAVAKLVPGQDSNPAQWQNYVSRRATASAAGSPGALPPAATAMQATTDPKTGDPAQQLVYHSEGYYTYTFTADITDPKWAAAINGAAYTTNGVVFDPDATHRIAIQLSYKNAAGEVVRVNPYLSLRFVKNAAGGYDSVVLTDPATQDYVMTDVSSCNTCHEKLALHGGGRVDTQYCVMCHNPGTTDPDSGNVLTMSTMTHKIHAGRVLAEARGGERYVIWGYNNVKHDYTEVGFPQSLQNCAKCHTAQNPSTPQGDNWKSVPSQEACLTCHASNTRSAWDDEHLIIAQRFLGPDAKAKDLPNSECARCHAQGTDFGSDIVHWNQKVENAAKYRMNIESVVFNDTADKKGRSVTVKYFLSDPTNGDAAYNLVTADCEPGPTCANSAKFGNLSFSLAYQNLVGQSDAVTEFSAYNNGGSGASAPAYKGSNDGNNHYTLNIPLPDDTATAVAKGTARVVSIGQVNEVKLNQTSAAVPRPPAVPETLVKVVVQQTYMDVVLSGSLQPRRDVVSTEKCNVCHGALGSSNSFTETLHNGARNTVEACVVCHDPNRVGTTVMTNGMTSSENFAFKRMIHGIHGNSKRTYPFTHGNLVLGLWGKDGVLQADGWLSGLALTAPVGTPFVPYATDTVVPAGTPFTANVINYAAEVAYPQLGLNCNSCHVNNSYMDDLGTLGAAVAKPLLGLGTTVDTDPNNWRVISPKAASCTACHDSPMAIGHVTAWGGAAFGDRTQGEVNLLPRETCSDCHASGGFMGVDIVHGLK